MIYDPDDLIEPVDVQIELLDREEQIYDENAGEPVHGPRGGALITLPAQVSSDREAGAQPQESGLREKWDLYIVVRYTDLAALGLKELQNGDRVVSIGFRKMNVFVDGARSFGHHTFLGGPGFVSYNLSDRAPTRAEPTQ